MMHEGGIDHAEVVINNENGPCFKEDGPSCLGNLSDLLGSKTLRVHWRDKNTGQMTNLLFGGIK
jgi:hypothetical protein